MILMPAPLRIILANEEDRTLRELSCANKVPQRTKQRAMALRLNAYGWNVLQIAKYLEWAEQTVRDTLRRWQQHGLGGLWESPRRGRHPGWTDEDRQLSHKLATERQVELGAEQVRRILKKKMIVGSASAEHQP